MARAPKGRTVRHVVVVGAGPGGLAAAVNLAGRGLAVTVVEKEAVPGGRMRGLTLGAAGEYQLDTGPSILQLPGVLERIVTRAGRRLEDFVTLVPVEPNTRVHFWDGTHLDTTRDVARLSAELARFGADKPEALRRWLADARGKYALAYEKFIATNAGSAAQYYNPLRLAPTLPYRPWETLHGQLMRFFRDERISYALAYPSKYLGLHPTTCSSVFSVIPYLELAFGVWHVKGGFRELARGLARCAESLGARFRYGAPVERVVVEGGRAVGVVLEGGERLDADAVVVNADLAYAATRLVPPEARAGTRLTDRALDRAKYSCSTFMAYYGVEGTNALPHHLIYLSDAARRTDREALEDRVPDLEDPPFYVCNPTGTDPSGAPAGHSTLYVLVPTPNTSRAVDWQDVEARLRERIPRWLEKVGLTGVRERVRAERYFTAETWRDDFNVFRGAVFNLSHTWGQLGPLRPKVKSPVPGLYWVGGGTHPGSGLLTIMESANIAADYLSREAGLGPLPDWPYVPPVPEPGQPAMPQFEGPRARGEAA